jgi:hypothetical protein
MTYKKGLVAALKVGGKILREDGDRVSLPFGSEYSVLLKNLDSVRVQSRIWIDGKDATDGTNLVLSPNSSMEIERFIRAGNLERGNRLKFIEKTAEIEEARGSEVDDGLIRVEFWREKVLPAPVHVPVVYDPVYPNYLWPYTLSQPHWPHPHYPKYSRDTVTWTSSGLTGSQSSQNMGMIRAQNMMSVPLNANVMSASLGMSESGITVPGSESGQKFHQVSSFATESQSEVVILHLVGHHGEKPVTKAVTVDLKPICATCRLTNKATSKFCSRCGTALEII